MERLGSSGPSCTLPGLATQLCMVLTRERDREVKQAKESNTLRLMAISAVIVLSVLLIGFAAATLNWAMLGIGVVLLALSIASMVSTLKERSRILQDVLSELGQEQGRDAWTLARSDFCCGA